LTLLVIDVAIFVDLLAGALLDVAVGQFGDHVAIFVDNIAFLVDLSASDGVMCLRFLFWLPSLCATNCVAVLIENLSLNVSIAVGNKNQL
jgi:hypothetical protein